MRTAERFRSHQRGTSLRDFEDEPIAVPREHGVHQLGCCVRTLGKSDGIVDDLVGTEITGDARQLAKAIRSREKPRHTAVVHSSQLLHPRLAIMTPSCTAR